jgi:hypothetical protein
MNWLKPALVGSVIGLGLLVFGWFIPSVALAAMAPGMLQPAYQMPELIERFVPEVLTGMQMAFGAGAAAVLAAFLTFTTMTGILARPTGPGEVGRGWRVMLWWALMLVASGLAYAAVEYFLSWQLSIVDSVAVTRIALAAMLTAAAAYWIISLLGVERMMRPAVPLASLR